MSQAKNQDLFNDKASSSAYSNKSRNSTNREMFYSKVNAAKDALILDWKNERCFKDKNNFKKNGLVPEGIGLTSVLLLLVAFGNDENVFSEPTDGEDTIGVSDFAEVINASFKNIFGWTANGFGAATLLNKKNAVLFEGGRDYTEAITWCLSSSVLAMYAEKKLGLISLEKDVHDGVLELLAKSVKALLNAQRADGTWGFTGDGMGKRSLYFTYIASASLGDFFDYILDEISSVEDLNGEESKAERMEDVISFLDRKLGIDTVAAVTDARQRLDAYLIESCLPILPKLARCVKMDADEVAVLGIWETPAYPDEASPNKKYYHNLYYTYYLLDMMIIASADTYFSELAEDDDRRAALLKRYEAYVDPCEIEYFTSKKRFKGLFANFYEQALHASRMNYMTASKTGDSFWDMSTSELPILWEHENDIVQRMAKTALDQSHVKLSDPTILPMALRANVVYSYYITEKPEVTIERLFDDICDNIYADKYVEDEDGVVNFIAAEEDDEHVKNLWDELYYNLMVTERSIEAVVDYYDYINKFDVDQAPAVKPAPVVTTAPAKQSDFEKAFEEKIAEYLQSEKGQAVIASVVAKQAAPTAEVAVKANAELSIESLTSLIALVNKKNYLQYDKNGNDIHIFMLELGKLLRKLKQCDIYDFVSKSGDVADPAVKTEKVMAAIDELYRVVATDEKTSKNYLSTLYKGMTEKQ